MGAASDAGLPRVKRNRSVVITIALVLLTLLGGIAATLQQARVAQTQARANRRLAYAGQMHLAMQAWELANMGQLRDLVEQSAPQPGEEDLRGFEWYYLWRLAYRNGERFSLPHPKEVWAVKYAPDRQRIVSGCDDGKLRIWATDTGKLLAEYGGLDTYIWDVAWSPAGGQIALALGDRTARLWDAATGRELAIFKGPAGHVRCLSFSPDGRRLVTGSSEGLVRLWDVATQQEVIALKAGDGSVNSVSFAPDGQTLVSSNSDPVVKLWRAAHHQVVR